MKLKSNYIKLPDTKLIAYSGKLFEFLSSHLDDKDIEVLNELLEVERELTLRENN